MQLTHIYRLTAQLVLQTGLHIGAGDSEIHIGGVDNGIIKHPVTDEPYIPGSSLKGKIRSLLEWRSGMVQEKPLGKREYDRAQDNDKTVIKRILQLFGVSGDTQDGDFQSSIGHTRLSFWDCTLDPEYVAKLRQDNLSLTEVKSENVINRIAGTAEHPRQTERIPAGAEFQFKLTLKIFDDDDDSLLDTVLEGLKLLEWDSLGGSGSRGYGKIKLNQMRLDDNDISARFDAIQPFAK